MVFTVPTLIPLVARLFIEGGNFGLSMAAMAILFFAYITFSLRDAYSSLRDSVLLRVAATGHARDLEESERRLRDFTEISTDWIWESDAQGRVIYLSAPGRQAKEDEVQAPDDRAVIGKTLAEADRIFGGDPQHWRRIEAAVARREEFRDVPQSRRTRSGALRMISINGRPVYGENGRFLGYRGSMRDRTKELSSQTALIEKTRILDAMLAALPDGVQIYDSKLKLITANDKLFKLLGIDQDKALAAEHPGWYIARELARRGEYGPGDPEELARSRFDLVEQPEVHYERQMKHGPWIQVDGLRIPDVGWIGIYRDISERKRRELQIGRQADLLNSIVANMGDGISVFDADKRLVGWNQHFLDLTGVDPAIARQGTPLRDILLSQARRGEFGPCDPETETKRRLELLKNVQSVISERTRPDGRIIELRRNPLAGGGFLTIYVDITARRRAERALRDLNAELEQRVTERTAALAESERFNRATIDSMQALLAVLDGSGRIIASNSAWRGAAAAGGLPWQTAEDGADYLDVCVHAAAAGVDGAGAVAEGIRDVMAGRRAEFEVEYVQPLAEGRRWFLCRVTRFGPTEAMRVVVVHNDVTTVRAALERAAASERIFESLATSSPVGVFRTDAQGGCLYVNQRWSEIAGMSAERARGSGWLAALHAEDRARVEKEWSSAVWAAVPFRSEFRFERPDGTVSSVIGQAVEIRDAQGVVTGYMGTLTDITERLRSEERLRAMQKMEAIGKLTGGLAHDLNNYLGIIIGNLDLLREDGVADSEAPALIEAALNGAMRGAELTRSLLAFSRRQSIHPDRADISRRLASIMDMLKRTLGEDITVKAELADDIWPVMIDGAQFDSCIVNLANNARDAMPRGGTLTIGTRNAELDAAYAATEPDVQPGQYAVVEVTDSGHGIPADVLANVFEPFFTTKAPGHGTGLGLSMVYGFVRQSGGHVKIYSEVGHGTCVRIYLPRLREAAPATASAAPAAAVTNKARGETVLVVEDNSLMRRTACAQLRSLGYDVVEADNAESGLAALDRPDLRVDLLFSDIVMPGPMSGYDLAKVAVQRRPGLKVLLTSGFPGSTLRLDGAAPLEFPLLAKPYRRDELVRAIRSVLEG